MTKFQLTHIAVLFCLAVASEACLRGDELASVPVLVKVLDEVEVSPREPGVLMKIVAREGQQLKQSEVLAQLDDTQECYLREKSNVELEIAAKEATSELGFLDAQKTMEVAQAIYTRALEAEAAFPDSISKRELELLRLDADKSQLAVQQAKHDQEIARLGHDLKKIEYEYSLQRVERRKIVAPFDGMVVEVNGRRGEWVQPGDRVIRMIRLDRLRVEGFLPARTARRELEGSPVRLSIAQPGRPTAQYVGKLVFVSPEVDPVNDQVRVFADIENPDLTLRPGLRGSLVIEFSGRR